jgi:hypothetical protein
MELIETKTLATAAASIEFTSIPQTFTDLMLVSSLRTNHTTEDSAFATINGLTTNQTVRILYGDGASIGAASQTRIRLAEATGSTHTANTFSNCSTYIANYSSTTTAKSFSSDSVNENNATTSYQFLLAQLWDSTAAITSLGFSPRFGTEFITGSTIGLYGITKGSDGIVTTS